MRDCVKIFQPRGETSKIQAAKRYDRPDTFALEKWSKIAKSEKRALSYGEEYLKTRWPNNTAKTTIWARSLFTEAEFEHEPASVINPGHVAASYYKKLAG